MLGEAPSWFNAVSGVALASTAGALLAIATEFLQRRAARPYQESIDVRISRLVKGLREATSLISEIQSEIDSRHTLVTKLRDDTARYEAISRVKKDEVEAIAQLLTQEVRAEGRRTFWQSVAVNTVFFLLGIGATLLIQWLS